MESSSDEGEEACTRFDHKATILETSFKPAGKVHAADIGRHDASPADFRLLKGLDKEFILSFFGKGRVYKKGRSLTREGYLSEFPIHIREDKEDNTVVITGCCWASQHRHVKYKLFVVLQPSSATDTCRVVYSRCACPAGLEKCVHLSALLQYCAAKAEFWEAWDNDDVSTTAKTSCTSRPRQWGIPKRRSIEPDLPVDEIIFQKVSSQKAFEPLSKRPRHMHDGAQLLSVPDDKEDICTSVRRELTSAGHTDESMALLRYIDESSDSDSDMENTPPRHRFDVIRPGPLQYPQYLKDALHLMNTDTLPPSPHQIEEWSSALTKALGNVDRDEVCRMTSEQSSCARWYTERLCRLTASKFRLIANRREKNMLTLVDELLNSAPPVTTGPLKFGRDNEPIAVEKYKEYMHERGHLVEVEKTGLHIHPSVSFLAASPDRLVLDPSCQPSWGLLEVKCMPSINGAPSDHAGKERFCLRTAAGESQCRLSKQHSFYYPILGQLASTARTWCDFVIMSQMQDVYVERVPLDEQFRKPVRLRLTRFF